MCFIRVCAWCGFKMDADNNALEPIPDHANRSDVSHGLCRSCKASLDAQMAKRKASRKPETGS